MKHTIYTKTITELEDTYAAYSILHEALKTELDIHDACDTFSLFWWADRTPRHQTMLGPVYNDDWDDDMFETINSALKELDYDDHILIYTHYISGTTVANSRMIIITKYRNCITMDNRSAHVHKTSIDKRNK